MIFSLRNMWGWTPQISFLQFGFSSLGTYDLLLFFRGPTPPGCTTRGFTSLLPTDHRSLQCFKKKSPWWHLRSLAAQRAISCFPLPKTMLTPTFRKFNVMDMLEGSDRDTSIWTGVVQGIQTTILWSTSRLVFQTTILSDDGSGYVWSKMHQTKTSDH